MVFQQTGKQDNAGRFERGYLKVTTENLTNWDLSGCEKPPKNQLIEVPFSIARITHFSNERQTKAVKQTTKTRENKREFTMRKHRTKRWIFIVGPFIGSFIAAGLWKLVEPKE